MALNIENIIAEIKEASILELNDLVKAIEEEFGVTAAAPVAAAADGAADAGAARVRQFDHQFNAASEQSGGDFFHRPDRPAVFPAAVFTESGLYPDVHGAAQQAAQPFYGKPSRWGAVQPGLAGVFGYLLHLRGEFFQILHDLRLGVWHCHHHAVAVLLHEHPVLRRRAEPVSDG